MKHISINEYIEKNNSDNVFYIENMNDLNLEQTSYEWICLQEKKSISEISKNKSYNIYDIRDEIICRLSVFNETEIYSIKKDWLQLFEYSFDINSSNEIFTTAPPYRILNKDERFVLLILMVLYKEPEKYQFIFLEKNMSDFLKYKIYQYVKNKKVVLFSNDINWIFCYGLTHNLQVSLFNNKHIAPSLYVEGDMDFFTFPLIYPDLSIKHGYTSSQLLWIAKKQKKKINHYFIDKDGYCDKAVLELKEFNIQTGSFSEMENFWIMPCILKAWLNDLQFSDKEVKTILEYNRDNILEKAKDNFDSVFARFKKRQKYIKQQGFSSLSESKIDSEYIKRKKNIEDKDIEQILSWLDNKNLFINIIKKAGYTNVKMWKQALLQSKLLTFKKLSKNIFNLRGDT